MAPGLVTSDGLPAIQGVVALFDPANGARWPHGFHGAEPMRIEQSEGGGRMSRRALFKTTVAAIAGLGLTRPASVPARAAAPLELPGDAVTTTFDFAATGVDGWTV